MSGVSASISKLEGIFAVRKPMGITSAEVVNRLKAALAQNLQAIKEDAGKHGHKKICHMQEKGDVSNGSPVVERQRRRHIKLPKMGHGGTLDMNATGVLVIGCGKGTKKLSSFLSGEKIYQAEGRLGTATDTMDASGKTVETADFGHVTEADFKGILDNFVGDILQVPPIYSALKVAGERMSDLAARGVAVEPKAPRAVKVYGLQCLKFYPPHFEIEVHCGGGFYVRKLIHDVGKGLGTCAHMTSLCRVQQGPFKLDQHALPEERWTLQDILEALEGYHDMQSDIT